MLAHILQSKETRQNHKEIKRFFFLSDRFLFHDQPLPSCNSDSILGDEEAGNGEDAIRAGSIPFHQYTRFFHQHVGADHVLRGNSQVKLSSLFHTLSNFLSCEFQVNFHTVNQYGEMTEFETRGRFFRLLKKKYHWNCILDTLHTFGDEGNGD